MTAKHWALFGVVQAVGIMLVAVSNIHTNILLLIVGYLLLAPGIFISSSLNLGGSAQSIIAAVSFNAVVWHFVVRWRRKKGASKAHLGSAQAQIRTLPAKVLGRRVI